MSQEATRLPTAPVGVTIAVIVVSLSRRTEMKSAEADRMEGGTLDAVVKRACAGDDDAFAELYRQFRRRVFGLCQHFLGPAAAEDASSEVFLRAKRAMSSYDSALPFQRWGLRIAAHHCVDQLRRRRGGERRAGERR